MSNYVLLTNGLALTFSDGDVWLNFKAENGKQCSLSLAGLAEKHHGLISLALSSWAHDRLREHNNRVKS